MIEPSGDESWQITFWNTAGYELPASGGSGDGPFIALGGLMLAVAGGMLARRKDELQR